MADKWEDKGVTGVTVANDIASIFGIDAGDRHNVEKDGETREVERHPGQSVGEAIANGQFIDKK